MEEKSKVRLTIDGKEVVAAEGATILEAAQQSGITIPTLCHHPAISNWGGCRMCVVEVDGAPRLVASCVMPVRPGMDVVTSNERIIESRRTVLEFLFAERNHNCMFCPQSGDCELQKLAYEMKMDHLSVPFSFDKFPTDVTSETMVMDHNRCILCGRCVRACGELAGNYVLNFQNRGPRSLIGLDLNETREGSTCYGCGLCLQVCPTGAITTRFSTHYAVKGHLKDWQEIESFCPECGLLCPTIASVKNNRALRIAGKLSSRNGRPDRGQLCYRGRFDVLRSTGKRLLRPMVKEGDGRWREETWEKALDLVATGLKKAKGKKGGKNVFGLASSSASNEELLFFRDLVSKGFEAGYMDAFDGVHFRNVLRASQDLGKGLKEVSWKQIPDADFVMLLGGDPHQTQPLISSLVRRSVMEKGIKVALVGEVGCLPTLAAYHLSAGHGSESPLIKALLAEVLHSGKGLAKASRDRIRRQLGDVNVQGILETAGLDENGKRNFYGMVEAFLDSKNPLLMVGETLTGAEDASGLHHAMELALLKGALPKGTLRLIILKPHGNSAGAWKLGLCSGEDKPDRALSKRGLVLLGEEKDAPASILDGLGELDFLAVLTPFFPDAIAEKAHVLIPKPFWMEEDGTCTSLDGREIAYKQRILEPPEGVQRSWRTLLTLANLSGVESDVKTWNDLRDKVEQEIERGDQG